VKSDDLPGLTGGLRFRLRRWWRRVRVKVAVMAWMLLMLAIYQGVNHGQYAWDRGPPAVDDFVIGTVPWWNDAVFYEVFVRSFQDSDGDGIGDLRGLTSRLDYLNDGDPGTSDDLEVTALWLMPVMQSPSYHGYDTTDYYTVEEDYGTNDDFHELVAQAHARGMRVVIDLMLNHTSDEHPWFADSASGSDAEMRDWYVWRDEDPGHQVRWAEKLWFPHGGAWYHSTFGDTVADLNYRNPDVTSQMYDVARFWVEEMGVDGFRLDAVRHLIEDRTDYNDSFPTHRWLRAWDDHLDTLDGQLFTVGEVWADSRTQASYVTGDEVDAVFEFPLADGILSSITYQAPGPFARALGDAMALYPPGQFAPFLTNHDQPRVMSMLDGDLASAKLAATTLLTLPGVPFLYYGEEIGMTGLWPHPAIRTPMQWTSGENAGFSTGGWWTPPNWDAVSINVADEDADPDSLLSHYRRVIRLRAAHPALTVGSLRSLDVTCRPVYAHLRSTADASDALLVVLNFSNSEQRDCALSLPETDLPAGRYGVVDLLSGESAPTLVVGAAGAFGGYVPALTLGPRDALVLQLTAQR
jgi:glycosidase